MFIDEPWTEVKDFINQLDDRYSGPQPGHRLSIFRRAWLAFCLMGILITNSVCWAKFERASLGKDERAALSWMFKHAKIPWEALLVASVRLILKKYHITEGGIKIDDSDKKLEPVSQTKISAFINSLIRLVVVTLMGKHLWCYC